MLIQMNCRYPFSGISDFGVKDKVAPEQKARSTYEYLIDLTDDPDVLAPLRFLREREIVHFQRFGEALDIVRHHLNSKHFFDFRKS